MDTTGPIQVTEQGGLLRIEWDNRKIKKERVAFWFLVLFRPTSEVFHAAAQRWIEKPADTVNRRERRKFRSGGGGR